jgi:ubiquinone/menaquinone biosynthesis C-methylase UbiE
MKKPFFEPSSPAAVFFFEFLKSTSITSGRLVDLGCGNGRNAIFFSKKGFEVHAVDKSDEILKDMDLHGVMPHCHSVTEYWLFEDSSFDIAMDFFCYSEQSDDERKKFYRSELMRVLKPEGIFLLCVPKEFQETVEKEFSGFRLIIKKDLEDSIDGKKAKATALIYSKN